MLLRHLDNSLRSLRSHINRVERARKDSAGVAIRRAVLPAAGDPGKLTPQARKQRQEVEWAKGIELVKPARRDRQEFDCATWLHKARQMPKEDFKKQGRAGTNGAGDMSLISSCWQRFSVALHHERGLRFVVYLLPVPWGRIIFKKVKQHLQRSSKLQNFGSPRLCATHQQSAAFPRPSSMP